MKTLLSLLRKGSKNFLWSSILLILSVSSVAAKTYDHKVLRIIDGDTLEIEANFLPDELGKKLRIRVLGVDTPEKGGLAKCELEQRKSADAKVFVEAIISKSTSIKVEFKRWDKYGGRVLGDVIIDGKRLSELLIESGHAIPYEGKKKVKDWCK